AIKAATSTSTSTRRRLYRGACCCACRDTKGCRSGAPARASASRSLSTKRLPSDRRDRRGAIEASGRRRMRLPQLLPGHGAHAHRAGDRVERRLRREVDAIALETGDALLIRAGPALVPGNIDMMGDLVCVHLLGPAIAGHAAKQRF